VDPGGQQVAAEKGWVVVEEVKGVVVVVVEGRGEGAGGTAGIVIPLQVHCNFTWQNTTSTA